MDMYHRYAYFRLIRNRQSLHHDYDAVYDSGSARPPVRILALEQKNKLVMSPWAVRMPVMTEKFHGSFGERKAHMYLANWYMPTHNYFRKVSFLLPSMVLATGSADYSYDYMRR